MQGTCCKLVGAAGVQGAACRPTAGVGGGLTPDAVLGSLHATWYRPWGALSCGILKVLEPTLPALWLEHIDL